MFGSLTEKFQNMFSGLMGKKTLTEDNISDAVREVRLALLDADVNYSVASSFVKRVKEKALGDAVIKSVEPGQQFTKLIHDELVALMGAEESELDLQGRPNVILLCGLQGSGKTTQCAKLAAYLQKKHANKRTLLAACDLQRPAAVEQLKRLGSQIDVPVFSIEGEKDPVRVAKEALHKAKTEGFDTLIVDTAGRLHIDEELMQQLDEIKSAVSPHEILFVASAATGQDAVKTAHEFDKRVAITGTILTMLDGSARAGAAISIREVTQKPLKFEGIGEKIGDLQPFNPHSMADRILGMGDVINLVRKAQENFDEEESKALEKKIMKASFTYDDYLKQMGMVKKMGSFKSILKMLPGMSDLGDIDIDEKELDRIEAMIRSMTLKERMEKEELVPSRRRRIAQGSGTSIDDVNKMVKGFKKLKQFCKDMPALKNQMKKGGKLPFGDKWGF
ncbi:MAG: signal recognition particle protein [Candidatus Melainabacteria bacterium]|nr:signal recognition particle protein [Candidatus Melainabacteria bacterium]